MLIWLKICIVFSWWKHIFRSLKFFERERKKSKHFDFLTWYSKKNLLFVLRFLFLESDLALIKKIIKYFPFLFPLPKKTKSFVFTFVWKKPFVRLKFWSALFWVGILRIIWFWSTPNNFWPVRRKKSNYLLSSCHEFEYWCCKHARKWCVLCFSRTWMSLVAT